MASAGPMHGRVMKTKSGATASRKLEKETADRKRQDTGEEPVAECSNTVGALGGRERRLKKTVSLAPNIRVRASVSRPSYEITSIAENDAENEPVVTLKAAGKSATLEADPPKREVAVPNVSLKRSTVTGKTDKDFTELEGKLDNARRLLREARTKQQQAEDKELRSRRLVSNLESNSRKAEQELLKAKAKVSKLEAQLVEKNIDLRELDNLKREMENLKRQAECKVCYEHESEVFLEPCRHLVCCLQCFSLLSGTCPICRTRYVNYKKIFRG